LAAAEMVMEELALSVELPADQLTRSLFPASGPIVICDTSGIPWSANEYRRKWRIVANHAGVPKTVRNMDSRAGAITEATEAGADLEHVKHAATHSDISQTQRYSRGANEKIASVQKTRIEFRKKEKYRNGD
jgi:site-specific recombinase XerD